MSDNKTFLTSFCNHVHSLETGEGVDHSCYRLSPTKLRYERDFGPSVITTSMTEMYPGEHWAVTRKNVKKLEALYWEHAPPMTIDTAIKALEYLRKYSKLKGNTRLSVCLIGSGIEYLQPKRFRLEEDDGALVLLDVPEHGLGAQERSTDK